MSYRKERKAVEAFFAGCPVADEYDMELRNRMGDLIEEAGKRKREMSYLEAYMRAKSPPEYRQ